MPVHKLGGVADGVRGDGALTVTVELAGGLLAEDDAEAQSGKESVPEGQIFVVVKAEGQADVPSRAGAGRDLSPRERR